MGIIMNSNPILKNVTIYDNVLEGIYCNSGSIVLNNCLLWGNNSGGTQIDTNPIPNITYSNIQGGWEGIGNIDAEPLLVDPTNGDFQPKWTATEFSPLIDTGDPTIFDSDGTPSDIGAVRAIDHKVETIELQEESINWLCFPVINTRTEDEALACNWLSDIWDDEILEYVEWVDQSGDHQFIEYILGAWTNDDHEFTSVQGYKISMHDEFNLEVTGFLESSDKLINLYAGLEPEGQENWIGYFLEESMEPLDALEEVLDDIDEIRTKYFALVKEHGEWVPPSEWTINYGDLVIVNCTNDCSFRWGQSGVPEKTRAPSEGFSYDEESDYIPVFVELDQQALGNPTEIGIFVESECKGAAVIEDSLVQICAYVLNDSIGFDPGEAEFQLYYGSRAENIAISNYLVKDYLYGEVISKKLDFSDQKRFYFVSFNDDQQGIPLPLSMLLYQNYPNPFNPETVIRYSIAKEGKVELTIYNIKGQRVKKLVQETKEPGYYNAIWNGTDDNNKQVASGIYLYRLSKGKKTLNKKMLLLK